MPSEHINLKFNQEYMKQIKRIGQSIGIQDISKVYGAIPQIIKFSITFTESQVDQICKVIPTLEPRILETLLLAIKKKKILQYHEEIKKKQQKSTK